MTNKIGRNEPCHCQSGKKYKRCCLLKENDMNADEQKYLQAKKWFQEKGRSAFIGEPYSICPKCKKEKYGVCIGTSNNHTYVRECIDCGHSERIKLPNITKKVIYLDQNILSGITNVLDTKHPEYETRIKKDPHYDFWMEAWRCLDRLLQKQLIICPDSFYHRHESLVAKNADKLFRVYEKMSHGITFVTEDIITRYQCSHYLKRHIGLTSGEISFDPQSIVTGGNINDWFGTLRISVKPMEMPDEKNILRESRQQGLLHLTSVHESIWRTTNKTFEEIALDEATSFMKGQINAIGEFKKTSEKITKGEIAPDIYNMLPPFAWDLLEEVRKIVQSVSNDPTEHLKMIDSFFNTENILSVPTILISSLLYASIAMDAKGGSNVPSRGVFNDVHSIASYLPYSDAIFVDNQNNRYLSSKRVASKISKFNTKVFSLSNKQEFLKYLNEVEQSANEEHLKNITNYYGSTLNDNADYFMYD